MKVLQVYTGLSPELGGPIPVIKGLSEQMAKRGIKVAIFVTDWRFTGSQIEKPDGVEAKVFQCGWLSRFWPGYSPRLARALQQEAGRFDIIHIHGHWNYPAYAAYRAASKIHKPYVVTIHGNLDKWPLRYKRFKKGFHTLLIGKRLLNSAALVHALTEAEARHIRDFGVSAPVAVIPNGICAEEFNQLPPRAVFEEYYPQLRDKIMILFLGRIHPQKGLSILTRAFETVLSYRDDVYLVIGGPDSEGYQSQVERMLEEQGVREKVLFTGMLIGEEKKAALSRADIFVLPSYSEGFSMAILEAMACGLPAVITQQCHFPEIADNQAGIVIDPDPEQLASALMELIENTNLRKQMGENARQLVLKRYTWDRVTEEMIGVYKSIIGDGAFPG